MHCDSCDVEKASAGSALYGAYKLCNDCLLDFTLSIASGKVDTVAEYMTRSTDGPSELPPPTDLSTRRDRQSIPVRQPREKLLPGHEPC
jgi:hypothetical protein